MTTTNKETENRKPLGVKKTLTLGSKSKDALKKLQETAEQKVGALDIRKHNLGLKNTLVSSTISKPATKKTTPKIEEVSVSAEDLTKRHTASLDSVDLTDSEKQKRLEALAKAKDTEEEVKVAEAVNFNVVQPQVFAPAPKAPKKPVVSVKEKEKEREEDTEEIPAEDKFFAKKKAAHKKKDKNLNESAWKTQYYQTTGDEEEDELIDEDSFLAEQEAKAAELDAMAQVDHSAGPVVTPFVNYRPASSTTKRMGKTSRDRRGAKRPTNKLVIDITGNESIKTLAHNLGERLKNFLQVLNRLEIPYRDENTILDLDSAELAVLELGHQFNIVAEDIIQTYQKLTNVDNMQSRPPVVTVMGHVDHGKTTLLDFIRKTSVVARESGGITQHIGAYQVEGKEGKKITFLDTPGHEAFAEMRARGATVTDIIVLVVAADDGLKQQSIEVINHAHSANVPIIVAINKMDKPNIDPMKVKTELLQHNVVIEDMGGKVQCVEISALKGTGVDHLLESILLEAEVMDIKADYKRPAVGTIIETQLIKGKGIVATSIIQQGILKQGQLFVVGDSAVKVRVMHSDTGAVVKEASPAMPVEIVGFSKPVRAGDKLYVVEKESDAEKLIAHNVAVEEKAANGDSGGNEDDNLLSLLQSVQGAEDKRVLPIILKTDVYGSKEAILGSLEKLGNEEVKVKVLHSGVGAINDSDLLLAKTSDAVIYGFNVRASNSVATEANRSKVSIRYYAIIYDLLDDVKSALSGLLAPKIVENITGYAKIKEVFNITKVGKIAGCIVTEGNIRCALGVRLLRNNVVIYEGTLSQLKHFKNDVKEVSAGQECGIALQNFQDLEVGDVLECYERISEARTL